MKKSLKPVIDEFEKQLLSMPRDEVRMLLADISARALTKYVEAVGDAEYAMATLGVFIIDAMLADGFIAEEEFRIFADGYQVLFGEEPSRSECEYALKAASEEFRETVGSMRNIMFRLDDDVREDIVKACMGIFAVDGKIDNREKRWLLEILGEEA